jgi:uncharacterized protein involved in type VI secretion and phage assembly
MFQNMFYGKVVDNQDPDGLNRVRVTMLGEQETVSDWTPVLAPFAGSDNGISMLPEVGDMVIIIAMDSAKTKKVVMGATWFNGGLPPQTGENTEAGLNGDGKNSLKFIKSRSGNMLVFDDTEGEEKFQLISADGQTRFEYSPADKLSSLSTENDITISAKGTITIDAEKIEITGKKQVNISGEEVQVSSKKEMDISSDKDLAIKGSGISLN